jgi:hypothetical protein
MEFAATQLLAAAPRPHVDFVGGKTFGAVAAIEE